MGLLIVSGLSGAGKSLEVHALEDIGYFCIDNLPPALLCRFVEFSLQADSKIKNLAVVMDVRGGEEYGGLSEAMDQLRRSGVPFRCLFLDSSNEVLERRYKETRRTHPLAIRNRISIEEAIRREREMLRPIAESADYVVDTSVLTTAQLRDRIVSLFTDDARQGMALTFISFGFKYGIPKDADLVLDVRFLPNPFYVEEMRHKSGAVPEVSEYIAKWPVTQEFLSRLDGMIDFLVPQYVKEGKSQLVIAVGCTGGMHRSVFVAKHIFDRLGSRGYPVKLEHRDLMKNDVWEHVREEC